MKQKTKRILAFAMAVVFALSTCVTSSPYTVMATEAGETIAPLAEEGSGSGEVTPGTTETGTPGESGEGGTVAPSGEPEGPTTPSAPPATETPVEKKYLQVKVVLGAGAGTIGGVDLGNVSFTLSNGENDVSCTVEPESSTTTAMEYAADKTYKIKEGSISDNSGMYTLGNITSTLKDVDSENPTLVLKIGKLTPKVGTNSWTDSIKALSEVKYTLDGNWSDKVDRWVIEGSNAAKATVDATGVVSAKVGGQSFSLVAYCGNYLLARKNNITVEKNVTSLSVTTSKSPESWKKPWDITIKLVDVATQAGIRGEKVRYTVEGKPYTGTTDANGEIKNSFRENKHHKDTIKVTADFDGDAVFPRINEEIWREISRDEGLKDEDNNVTYDFITYVRK